MKKIIFTLSIFFYSEVLYSQSVAINTNGATANASSILDITSTTKGLLIPRMTTVQRTAIATPAKGLIVFDITTNGLWFHDGMAWEVLSAGSSTNYWSLNGSDIYNNTAGNVGIGTIAPLAYGHGGNNRITEISNTNTGINIQSHLILSTGGTSGSLGGITWASQNVPGAEKRLGFIGDVYETSNAARMVFYTRDEAGVLGERLTMLGNGNVGVGASDPSYKMDIAGRIRIRSGSGGITNSAGVWLNNPANTASVAFMGVKDVDVAGIYGNVSGWGLLMNTNTGAVGIGYQNPVAGYRLSVLGNQYINGLIATTGDAEIGGAAQVSGNLNVGGFIGIGGTPYVPVEIYSSTNFPVDFNSGWSHYNNGPQSTQVCIRTNGGIISEFFEAFSDARIKNIAGISSSANDLNTINTLQVTDYTMKDKMKYGNKPFKKIIAQELEKVYPQIVSKNTGCIPNVYAVPAKIEKTANGYLLSFTEKHTLSKTAKKIQLIIGRDTKQFYIIAIPSEKQVEIKAADLKTDKVFVYGEEVDDFRTVDYEGLTTLNISATQELSKLAKKQQAIIETQQQQIDQLIKRLEVVEKNSNVTTTDYSGIKK